MVQRYEVKAWGLPEPEMAEYAYGDYVEYDAYLKLEAKLREFAEQVINEPCSKVTEEMAREILGI